MKSRPSRLPRRELSAPTQKRDRRRPVAVKGKLPGVCWFADFHCQSIPAKNLGAHTKSHRGCPVFFVASRVRMTLFDDIVNLRGV